MDVDMDIGRMWFPSSDICNIVIVSVGPTQHSDLYRLPKVPLLFVPHGQAGLARFLGESISVSFRPQSERSI